MTAQWAPGPLHSKGKIRVFLLQEVYLLLLFIQWVWANMDIAQHKDKKSVRLWSNKWGIFHFKKVEVSYRVCCYSDIITMITISCSSCSTSTLPNFNPVDLYSIYTDFPYFVISHHFVSTLWRHKSSNLHKSKSSITRQPRALSQ